MCVSGVVNAVGLLASLVSGNLPQNAGTFCLLYNLSDNLPPAFEDSLFSAPALHGL